MSPVRNAAFLRETELAILNAPFEERGWEHAVSGFVEASGSAAGHLLGIGGPLLLPLNVFSGDVPGIERYLGDPRFHGATNWRVGSVTVPMAIQHEAHYSAYRLHHDTSDYDDAASDLDIMFGCQSALLLDSENMLGIALLRGSRHGPCTQETLEVFARLRVQLARAVRMQIALDGEAAEMMVGDTAALHGATILLDRHGNLCALSAAAEHLFEAGGPLRLAGLNVRLSDRREDDSLQKALGRLLASDGYRDPVVHEMPLGRSGGGGPLWRLFAVRLPHRDNGLGFEPHLAISLKQAEQVAGAQRREAA